MNNQETYEYKGYLAFLKKNEETGDWHGRIPGMDRMYTLQAKTLPKMKDAVKEVLDWYFEECEEERRQPCKQNIEEFAQAVG